jgi:methanol metabolism-related c-type cytochrome
MLNIRAILMGLALCTVFSGSALADASGDPKAVKEVNGLYQDKDGNPTFNIKHDGSVDWYTYSGYLRFNSMCIVCHGPDGAGSSYAPDLTKSLNTINYGEFLAIVAQGRRNISASTEFVMPSFGDNKNVVCYLDNIYIYLRGRSDGAVGRGRPEKHDPKPPAAAKAENECMGTS